MLITVWKTTEAAAWVASVDAIRHCVAINVKHIDYGPKQNTQPSLTGRRLMHGHGQLIDGDRLALRLG